MVSEFGSRDKWPTARVDLRDELENAKKQQEVAPVDVEPTGVAKIQESGKQKGRKGRASFMYQPDAYDERMYATYLTQKVVFTREYPYAKSIRVLARKDWLEDPDEEPPRKPSYKMPIAAVICCFPIGLFALLHFMRALSAFESGNTRSQCKNARYMNYIGILAIFLGSIAWILIFIRIDIYKSSFTETSNND